MSQDLNETTTPQAIITYDQANQEAEPASQEAEPRDSEAKPEIPSDSAAANASMLPQNQD